MRRLTGRVRLAQHTVRVVSYRIINNNTNKNDSILISSSSSHLGLLRFSSKQWDDPYMKMHENGIRKATGASVW